MKAVNKTRLLKLIAFSLCCTLKRSCIILARHCGSSVTELDLSEYRWSPVHEQQVPAREMTSEGIYHKLLATFVKIPIWENPNLLGGNEIHHHSHISRVNSIIVLDGA